MHVERTLRAAEDDHVPTDERRFRTEREGPTTWETILALTPDAIVLISPSQSGKTTEFQWLAQGLRLTSRFAVYLEAGACGRDGVRDGCYSHEDRAALELWRESPLPTPLYLLVDAVDEVRLHATTLEAALRRIGHELDCRRRTVIFLFSARSGSWLTPQSEDLRRGLTRLGFPEPNIRLCAFDPLTLDNIRTLARLSGARNLDGLLAAVREDDIETLISLRPVDVANLVRRWNEHGALGTWTDYLTRQIDSESTETAPGRSDTLAPIAIRAALERCAAASVFTKTAYFSLPGGEAVGGALSSRRLFDDWPFTNVQNLFERPLFVPKGPDAVQLPQGAWVPFLAARWLAKRVSAGMSHAELRAMLIVQLEDGTYVLPPSRRATAGWVASMIPDFRRELLAHSPVALLYEGDPQRLSVGEVDLAFTAYLSLTAKLYNFAWPTRATWRRVARPELEDRAAGLLREHLTSPAALVEVLHLAEHGKYQQTVPLSLSLAMDSQQHSQVRSAAIRVVAAAGTPEQICELRALLGVRDDGIRTNLLNCLPRSVLSGDVLHQFLAADTGFGCLYQFTFLAPTLPVAEVDSLIDFLLARLRQPTQERDLASVLRTSVATRLARPGLTDSVFEALLLLEQLQRNGSRSYGGIDADELQEIVSTNQAVRRRLCLERLTLVESNRDALITVFRPEYGHLQSEDLDWVLGLFEPDLEARGQDYASALIDTFQQAFFRAPTELQAQVRSRTDLPSSLHRWLLSQDSAIAQNRQREAEAQRDADEELAREVEALRSVRDRIRTGHAVGALQWAWHRLGDESRIDLAGVREILGTELTDDIRVGFVATWRARHVPARDPEDSSIPGEVLFATTGLTLAIQGGLDLSSLSPHEAELAARIGIRELNSFPSWFDELARVQAAAVSTALTEAIKLEWPVQGEHHFGILGRAAWAEPRAARLMKETVLDLLRVGPPQSAQTTHAAIDALLTSTEEWSCVEELIRAQVFSATQDNHLVEWLRGWAHVAPRDCAAWLQTLPAQRRDTLGLLVGSQVEGDLDPQRNHGRALVSRLREPDAIAPWVHLMLVVVPPSGDLHHQGVYTPSPRDKAQDVRRRLLDELASDPQPAARRALHALREVPGLQHEASLLDRLIDRQAEAAAERLAAPWRETDLLAVERGDERAPASREELFHLVGRHLRHVAQLVESDDFSYRRLFSADSLETEIQLWAASCLRERSRRLYSVLRENTVDDDKEVDITATCDGVGQIPIEIKPLGRYSFVQLQRTIEEQLLGRYMRPPDRDYGILLLVQKERRRWRVQNRYVSLGDLVAALQRHADTIGLARGKVIRVLTIDLVNICGA